MPKPLIILDPGHGGIINGKYVTPGKRATHGDRTIYEGVFNRDICARIEKLVNANIPGKCTLKWTVEDATDLSLPRRSTLSNKWAKTIPNSFAFLISVHANAHKTSDAKGWVVFTSPGQTDADPWADVLFVEMLKQFPEQEKFFRSRTWQDGDHDAEANFHMLTKTSMPALLSENFFMTNPEDFNILMSNSGRDKIAMAHFKLIEAICEQY